MAGGGHRRVGIFGGSFDPPHKTHIALAERAREFLGLDLLVFVPANSSPPKFGRHFAPFEDRIKMLEIALGGFGGNFEISRAEARSDGATTYAADTAEAVRRRFPAAELFWILGADMLTSLPHWYGIERLAQTAVFAYAARAGVGRISAEHFADSIRLKHIPFGETAASSSAIRAALKSGETKIPDLDCRVLAYILENRLYT